MHGSEILSCSGFLLNYTSIFACIPIFHATKCLLYTEKRSLPVLWKAPAKKRPSDKDREKGEHKVRPYILCP